MNDTVIIRPAVRRSYTRLPNSILRDDRLSIETRGMISLLVSMPPNWKIMRGPLMRLLSRKGEPFGRYRLDRMFREAMSAGYMARSVKQGRDHDGTFGSHAYIVGLPDDVSREVNSSTVAFMPHVTGPQADVPRADELDRTHKEQSLTTTESKKLSPKFSLASRARKGGDSLSLEEAPEGCPDQLTREMRDAGYYPVVVGSQPYAAWVALRGADGMPAAVRVAIKGVARKCCWMSSLWPPGHRGSADGGGDKSYF